MKRRNVFKISIAYIIGAWLILQVSDVILNNLGAPEWVFKVILLGLSIGLPVIVLFSWAFDWTPEGFRLTDDSGTDSTANVPNSSVVPSGASVAVLPFVNMSGDPDNEYFSDGLSEELLNVLSKISLLKVAARTSSFHFKGQTGDIAEIARRLGVASVLEGSVRQSGSRVRITAQLVNAADGYHLWSETFDRELDDIFAVQDEISSAVADALKIKLLSGESDHRNIGGTTNTEAFQAYLQGMHYRNKGPEETAIHNAIKYFQRAIDLDPGYARAYAGKANGWQEITNTGLVELDEGNRKAIAAAAKAIELAPGLADAHQIMSKILVGKIDFEGSRKAIDTAIKLNPGSVDVQITYARNSAIFGDHEASVAAARKAQELDPVSLNANHFLGFWLYMARRYDEAITASRHALDLDPHHPCLHYCIGTSQFMLGDFESAVKEIEQETMGWMHLTGMAIVLQRLGRVDEADAMMSLLLDRYGENSFFQHAQVYVQWGDYDRAMKNLERAYEISDPGLSQVGIEPLLDPIRDDPRFIELIAKLGFEAASA